MDFLSYILAGIIQGVTEWLPISSSGQSMIALINLLGLDPQEAFSLAICLHLGTLLAVVVRMRSDIYYIILKLPDFRKDLLVQFIIVSTFFSGLVGLPVYLLLKEGFSAWQGDIVTALIGFFLVLTGIILYLSKKVVGSRGIDELSVFEMASVGVAQGFTPLPGISRSGTTVAFLLFIGVKQENALRLSFLMSIPATLGILFFELFAGTIFLNSAVLFGMLAAFISGYVSIDLLLKFAQRIRFYIFCIVFGLLALLVPILTQLL